MIAVLWTLASLAPPPAAAGRTLAEDLAFLELEAARAEVFVHEPLRLVLRVGVDARFLADQVLQPFQRPLDLPLEVRTRGLWEVPGIRPFAAAPGAGGERASFALDGARALGRRAADREGERRAFRVLEHELVLVASSPGEHTLPAPGLRLVYGEEFREDFLAGRVPVERHELLIEGRPLSIRARPLPEEGRPPDFSGGVGRFELEAELESSTVELGASARLVLTVRGNGDLARLEPPRLGDLADFHLYGLLDEPAAGPAPARRLTYDLAPRSTAVREVPPVRLVTFDPEPPGSYRTLQSPALPLVVVPGPGGETVLGGERASGPVQEPAGNGAAERGPAPRGWPWARLGLVLLVLALAGRVLARRRSERRSRPAPRPALDPEPARAFERALGDPGTHPEAALCAYLGARLGRAPAALIDPRLAERLEAAGLAGHLAERCAELVEGLVGSRYGGPPVLGAGDRARLLVGELERAFEARTNG